MKINKSFRFTIRLGGAARPQPAGSPPAATEASFQPAASRYRRRLGRVVAALAAGFVLSALSLVVPDSLLKWLAVPAVGLIALGLILFFSLPVLPCPACGRSADGFAGYCPSCGAAGLKWSWITGAHCAACGGTFGRYKYRNYKIRFCTHCGALLDRAGV